MATNSPNNRNGTQRNTATEHFRSAANRIGTEQAPKGGCSSAAAIAPATASEQETFPFRCDCENIPRVTPPNEDRERQRLERVERLLSDIPQVQRAAVYFDERAAAQATAAARRGAGVDRG